MPKLSRRHAIAAGLVALGGLLGFLCGEAARQKSTVAEAAKVEAGGPGRPQRFGSVIGVRREALSKYINLHKAVWPGVLQQLHDSNIRNYSIYLGELDDGKPYLFSYYEYVGGNFDADMEKLKANKTVQTWWKETDPLQVPQKNRKTGEHWMTMQEVFHTD